MIHTIPSGPAGWVESANDCEWKPTSNGDKKLEPMAPIICTARLAIPGLRGLHGRAAAMLVRLEHSFDAELILECCGQTANAKSIMGILSLGSENCTELTATATGPEAPAMIRALAGLFANGFAVPADGSSATVFRHKFANHFHLPETGG
jgi:phosphocarrier protein HPr